MLNVVVLLDRNGSQLQSVLVVLLLKRFPTRRLPMLFESLGCVRDFLYPSVEFKTAAFNHCRLVVHLALSLGIWYE